MRLQKTGHRDSDYERPNQRWICGYAAEGRPCPAGPGPRGRCTAEAQSSCAPRKESDRWFCGRLSAFGGPCEPGPLPDGRCCGPRPTHAICQPRLSLRAQRGRLVASCAALTIGLLAVLLAGPWNVRFISPGDLASVHASVEDPQGSGVACAACHAAGGTVVSRWLAAAVGSGNPGHDSENCLQCHFDTGDRQRANAMFVHGRPPEFLALKTERARARDTGTRPEGLSLRSLAGSPPVSSSGTIACAVCHGEHRGREHRLTAMDNQRCQACHVVTIGGIADGHAEFAWEDRRPSWTNFDHTRHRTTHFGAAEFVCGCCHVNNADGQMSLEPFEGSCAGCHDQGNPDHHGDRIRAAQGMMIQLPYMDLDDDDVFWPSAAAVGAELPLLTRFLLAGDPAAADALRSLADPDVADALWTPEEWYPDDEGLKVDLASALKRLIDDLAAADRTAIVARLARGSGLPAASPAVVNLADQLRASAFAAAEFRRLWWVEPVGDDSPEPPWTGTGLEIAAGASGWVLNMDKPGLEYRPLDHADGFLKAWTDVLVESGAGSAAQGEFAETLNRDLLKLQTASGFLYTTCLRCHVSRPEDESAPGRIDWRGTSLEPHLFTKFNHTPHLRVAGDQQCGRCHQFVDVGEEHTDPTRARLRPDLFALEKATCTACHGFGGAPQSCLTCHDYHAQGP